MEIPRGRGSNAKPSGTENPVGWGVKLEKTLRGGGTWIFSGSTHWITRNFLCVPRFLFRNVAVNSSSTVRSDLGVFSVSLLGSSSLISCVSYFCDQSLQSILSMPSNFQGVFHNVKWLYLK